MKKTELIEIVADTARLLSKCGRGQLSEKLDGLKSKLDMVDNDSESFQRIFEELKKMFHPRGQVGDVALCPTIDSGLTIDVAEKKKLALISNFWKLMDKQP